MSHAPEPNSSAKPNLISPQHFKEADMQDRMASDTDAHHDQPTTVERLEGKAHVLAGKVLNEVCFLTVFLP